MNELQEISKMSLEDNLKEIKFQYKMGENLGGTICAFFIDYVKINYPDFNMSLFLDKMKKEIKCNSNI